MNGETARTIWSLFEDSLQRWPDARMVFGAAGSGSIREVTPAELHAQALQLARGLRRRGLRAGDVIVVQLPHGPENIVTFLAAMALGLVFVPVVHNYGSSEIGFMLKQTAAKLLVMPAHWHNFDYAARAAELEGIATLQAIAFTGAAGGNPFAPCCKAIAWQSLLVAPPDESNGDRSMESLPVVAPDAVCTVLYTSGTTSAPKGVMHSHASLIAEGMQTASYLDSLRHRTQLQAAPAGHIGPLLSLLRQMLFGIDIIHLDRWDAALAVDLIERYKVGWGLGVPLYLDALIAARMAGRVPTFGVFMVGGTSVPPALVERADRAGIRAGRSYGSTEHPTISQGKPHETLTDRARTDGSLMPGCRLLLVDDDGHEVPAGTPGEILSRGDELFVGYFDRSLDGDAFTADGWFRTGDVGVLNTGGFLQIVDRKKDIIIRGGENISSKEVEDVLSHHPAVLEAAAVGWPDARLGEKVGAFVRLREGGQLTVDDLRGYFQQRGMARIKIPEHLIVVDDFPRNPAGKILKTALRARAREAAAA